MQHGLRLQNYKITRLQNSQRGYMLITLMLVMALMTIALLAAVPVVKQQIMRDREEEMRHRGTAYMRAIQHYYKKFNAYPNKVEDLENTNNLRFLRKRYTDPMTRDPVTGKEKDFKFLHQQDVSLNNGPVLPGQAPGQNGPGGPGGFGAQGGFGGGAQSGFGGSQSAFGGNQGGFGGPSAAGPGAQNSPNSDADNSSGGPGSNGPSSGGSSFGGSSGPGGNSNSFGPSSPGSPGSSSSSSSSGLGGQVFGGGPILGVASTNKKDKSIHEFFGKTHYNDWLFIYMPMADRGGLLVGPVNPSMPTGNVGGLTPGQMAGQGGLGQGGVGQSGFGQSGFGQSGFGQGQGQGLNGGQNQGLAPQAPQQTPQQ
jgi:type II secretory pathway pseudopilin PulG